ncbi:cationic amino acid transporter 2-like [Cimex lectularius]|uniref:Cationic amino acid transporter C-terminal domain-containing protein n=1 Tax=Cimex lectularius TaxID=79782 RepID=A0A8I6REG3_CIMLE|nr:cationic amino acid transporter 2-like [Cimex lectularius]
MIFEIFKKENFSKFFGYMSKKKEFRYEEKGPLNRVLTILDLTFLGIGSMLGMGVYIMVGDLSNTVGPAMLLSFVVAGFACILSAMCYAEFAGRTPGTGSAYAYCYITVGEFTAFILGWNLCLEFVIGSACLGRGMSGYIDSIFDGQISSSLNSTMPMNFTNLAEYPDFLSFALIMLFTVVVISGVKESTTINNIFVVINIITISVLVVIGFMSADIANWRLKPTPQGGKGGFMPFGFSGLMKGASKCFYAYTGFDTVATTGGEAKNPQRTIPISLLTSILCAIVVYTAISATFSLMYPYNDPLLSSNAPYPYILQKLGWHNVQWIVVTGAVAAVTGCLLSSVFGMARIVYSIAEDGLIFSWLAKINPRTKTPIRATIVSGILTGLISLIFNTSQLLDMTALGTLMAYTMVGVCILILRYEDGIMEDTQRDKSLLQKMFNVPKTNEPDTTSSNVVKISTYLAVVLSFLLGSVFAFLEESLVEEESSSIILAIIFSLLLVLIIVVITRQPQSKMKLVFKVAPVPLLPIVCIFINVYLMLKLPPATWLRFVVWLLMGLLVYFAYGIWNSKERIPQEERDKNRNVLTY